MLSKNNFYKLRADIVLNSCMLKDYENVFYILPTSVCAFFNNALDEISADYKSTHNGADIDIRDVTTAQLYRYYTSCADVDPLWSDAWVACVNFSAFDALLLYEIDYNSADPRLLISYYHQTGIGGNKTTPRRWYKLKYDIDEDDYYIIWRGNHIYIKDFIKRY